jgi:MFS family permease
MLASFVVIEMRSRAPIMPLRIWTLRNVAGANVVGFLTGASFFAMFFVLTLYMQQVLGYSAREAGVAYLAVALSVIIAAAAAGRLVTVLGVKTVVAVGLAIASVGLIFFTQVSADGNYWSDLFPGFIVAGAGLGLSFVPVTIAALAGVEDRDAGLASGLINTSQQIGGALGSAICSTVAASLAADKLAARVPPPVALTKGFQRAFVVCTGFALAGLVVGLLVITHVRVPETAAEPVSEPA